MRTRHPYIESRFPDPIEMLRPGGGHIDVPTLAPGYAVRAYDENDGPAYHELFALAWPDTGTLAHTRTHALPDAFLVVEHTASRQLVSSCIAFAPESPERHPHDGSLGWLVTDPAHARRGLAAVVASMVTNLLVDAGYQRPWLQTEDDRIAAIRLYLSLGWHPHLYAEGMEARWRAIFERIGEPFAPERCIR